APMAADERRERPAYVITRDGTSVRSADGSSAVAAAGGVLLPIIGEVDGGYRVFDTCNNEAIVAAHEVEVGTVPADREEGRFDHAVFVIDPGHGVPDYGAVGPNGLTEAEVNLDVAARLVELLRATHDVDWTTGEVRAGDSVPAAAVAVLTRSPEGPNGGQYQLGLTFRARVANALDATALVSIHHNTMPEAPLDHPGSEAFVSLADPDSPRLGALIVEELRSTLSRYDADWMGTPGDGLTSRVNGDGDDWYTLLAEAEVPAVISEGLYISNPTEEALAMRDDVRQAYAEAVYRALVRFVTTDDTPLPPPEPDLWEVGRPGPSLAGCTVPPLDGWAVNARCGRRDRGMEQPPGTFYIGAVAGDDGRGDPLFYESDDLVTHGVIVGMTGSGKTGLGMVLLEEALAAGIPCLVIDPKGDMGNLELIFP